MGERPVQFNLVEAMNQLSRIIDRVEGGEEVIISRAGRPVAKVVPLPASVERTGRGSLAGRIRWTSDWDSVDSNADIARDFGPPL